MNSSILYAATEGSYPAAGFAGLFKSVDGGANWVSVNDGLATLTAAGSPVMAIAIDPVNANVVYLGTTGGGVFRSTDAGVHWSQFNDGFSNLNIQTLGIAPGTLYAGTDAGVFSRSINPAEITQ